MGTGPVLFMLLW